ncbi:hypothetical protein ACX2QB_06260 [Weissella viridescens]
MPIKKFMLLISLGLSLFLMPKPASADLTADLNRPNQTIELRENLSFKHNNYDIKLDGEKVGYVTGDFFHPFGDTISIHDNSGKVIYSERQQRRRWSFSLVRQGSFYDKNHQFAGKMKAPFWQFFTKNYRLYDSNGKQIGKSTQNNWKNILHHTYDIKSGGQVVWQGRNSVHVVRDTVYLKHLHNSKVPAEQAIIVTLVHQAVSHADKKK